MIKTFCDRCGKEYTQSYGWLKNKHYYTKTIFVNFCRAEEDERYLCPDCTHSYIHWFMHPEDDIEGE